MTARRRPAWLLWVLAVLLLTPVVELLVVLAVADRIGGWALVLLAASTVAGVLVLSRGSRAAWRRARESARQGRAPQREAVDGALTVVGGVLLLVPGFVTDVLAVCCLLPPLRWGVRALVVLVVGRWAARAVVRVSGGAFGDVVTGQVVLDAEPREDTGSGPAARPVQGRVLPPRDPDGPRH
ncbi:FxsA family protein [Thalassiella azotivora]